MKKLTVLFLLFPVYLFGQNIGIGQWRDHLSYYNATLLEPGKNKVYAASNQGVVCIDFHDNSVSKYTKISGLNDVNISSITYDEQTKMLIIGYNNGNIDFLKDNGQVINMPDIKRANIIGDKVIKSIVSYENKGYLACGFGIVVCNLTTYEVIDTYKFGPNGSKIDVSDICILKDSIYAASAIGVYRASLKNDLLINFENWKKEAGFPQENGPFNQIEAFENQIIANYRPGPNDGDKVLVRNTAGVWDVLPNMPLGNFSKIRGLNNKLVITGQYACYAFNTALQSDVIISQKPTSNQFLFPNDAFYFNNQYWVGDKNAGLLSTDGISPYKLSSPNGPLTNNVFKLFAQGPDLYVATGTVNQAYNNQYRQDGIPHFNGDSWSTPDENSELELKTASDFLGVTIDPGNNQHAFVASWDRGLIELQNNKVVAVYDKSNSAIQEVPGFNNNYRVACSSFDSDGNLWVGNSFAPNNLVVKTNKGEWYNFKMGPDFGSATTTTISQMIITVDGAKWMIRHRNGLYVYQDNNSITNTNDDKGISLTNAAGQGGLPSNEVYCIIEDLDGEIWIGTDKGFAILYSPSAVFTGQSINFNQPIIEQDGNFEKILETEVINSIAVDGGNRKWMATAGSGVYLISEDGTKEIQHFTSENSPLLSNEVYSLSIDQVSGEVFFGTSLGIQSYLSDATGPSETISSLTVFPNPIRPEYSGMIAIRGFVRDTKVKITDISGNIISELTSRGGEATWDGLDFKGEKPASGVYLVFATNFDGSETGVGKIVFVR